MSQNHNLTSVAENLIQEHFELEPNLEKIVWINPDKATEVRLLEINSDTITLKFSLRGSKSFLCNRLSFTSRRELTITSLTSSLIAQIIAKLGLFNAVAALVSISER